MHCNRYILLRRDKLNYLTLDIVFNILNINSSYIFNASKKVVSLRAFFSLWCRRMGGLLTRLYTWPVAGFQSLNAVLLFIAACGGLPAWADEPADQLERARLLRELEEMSSPGAAVTINPASLPPATTDASRLRATENLRSQQFKDSQWRKMIGEQQMQLQQPSVNASASQWRSQIVERDRQAQDLSADILRRDQEYRSGWRR